MAKNKFMSLMGICQKAGRLVSGEFACENAVKAKKAKLIVIAEDASENTKKKFGNSAKFYNINLICAGSKDELGKVIGRGARSVVAITDEGFATELVKVFNS